LADQSLITVLSAALTPVIAVGAAYIAYQNMNTAKHKIKIDLFEKRLKVYNNLKDLTSRLYTNLFPEEDPYLDFVDVLKEAQWLYDKATIEWIDNHIGVNIRDMVIKNDEVEMAEGEDKLRARKEMRALRSSLVAAEHEMRDVFSPFLKIHEQ